MTVRNWTERKAQMTKEEVELHILTNQNVGSDIKVKALWLLKMDCDFKKIFCWFDRIDASMVKLELMTRKQLKKNRKTNQGR